MAVLLRVWLQRWLRLDCVVCVVDAKNFPAQLARGDADANAGGEVRLQVASAERIIVNKADLVTPADLAAVTAQITAISPLATVVPASRCDVRPLRRFDPFLTFCQAPPPRRLPHTPRATGA